VKLNPSKISCGELVTITDDGSGTGIREAV
jgi:hypothetical protein